MAQSAHKDSFHVKHRIVLKDFYKCQLPSVFGYLITVLAAVAAVLMLYSIENKLFFWLALGVTAFMLVLLIIRVISIYHTAPLKYKELISTFPEDLQDELLREYPDAKKVGLHRYMSRVLIFYDRNRIYAVRYSDVTEASPNGRDLMLHLRSNEQPLRLPCPASGMSAIVYAYLRSKNPEIKTVGNTDRKETTV